MTAITNYNQATSHAPKVTFNIATASYSSPFCYISGKEADVRSSINLEADSSHPPQSSRTKDTRIPDGRGLF
jgi:hypothetical protein